MKRALLVTVVALAACASSSSSSPMLAVRPLAKAPADAVAQNGPAAKLRKGLSVLYSFQGPPGDGATPFGGVAVDAHGNIFGTTFAGGQNSAGTVYELTPAGRAFGETVVHSFDTTDGSSPAASPLVDASGNLYVTATEGGAYSAGTAIELSPAGSVYSETGAYSFGDRTDGGSPNGAFLEQGTTLYATTAGGGTHAAGAIVALTASGLDETDVYDFKNGPDGAYPLSNLVADAGGALYGTTVAGGSAGAGTVFKFVPSAKGGSETVLWSFQSKSPSDGASPNGGVVLDAAGNLYGTAPSGGGTKDGVVFRLKRVGNRYHESLMHTFSGGSDGSQPIGGLALIGTTLYGTTSSGSGSLCIACGTLFRIETSGSGYEILHTFENTDGKDPLAAMFVGGGALYGTTSNGGVNGLGVVFRYVP